MRPGRARPRSVQLQEISLALGTLVALGALGSAPARADDWPQWRGPRRDGVWAEQGVLDALPDTGLEVRWRYPVGLGFSSPMVADGRVFVTGAELLEPKVRESIVCLDAKSGERLWSRSAFVDDYPDWIFQKDQQRGPGSTPVARGGKVYALGGFGAFACLDAATGAVVWHRSLHGDYKLRDFPLDASPLIEGELLIAFIGSRPGAAVVAWDLATGQEVWRALDESSTHSSPMVLGEKGARQLVVWTQESVTSLDPANGKLLWREPLPTSADYAVATPVVQGERLLVGGLLFKLDPTRSAATIVWPQTRALARRVLSNTSTAAILGEQVYSVRSSGAFVGLDAKTGEELWATEEVTDLKTGASVHITLQGDGAFLFTDRGELIRARLSRAGYEERGRVCLIEPTWTFGGRRTSWAPPAFSNGCVFVRNDREVVCASLAAKR